MSKISTRKKASYICTKCGHSHPSWVGKCAGCGEFATIEEQSVTRVGPGFAPDGARGAFGGSAGALRIASLKSRSAPPPRATTGLSEFDRVLGGGIVEGSAILIGGDPGVGKSTLLLQSAARMSRDRRVVYVSGEESLNQIQMRAQRLGVEDADIDLISTSDCLAVADFTHTMPTGSIMIIDSIQTMDAGVDSTPGSVSQVKAAAASLISAAKTRGVALIVVSHMTKDGSMAGPNILQHAVDAVLYIEADSASGVYRIARAQKNRYGATDEVGVFEMSDAGLEEVSNPSEIFIAQRDASAFGTVIFPSLEGTRPLLLEVQALVAPTAFGTGRRAATGWDVGRMNMVLATLSSRMGLVFMDLDVYVNVAGGLKVTDPAMDLAVVTALLSARAQTPLPADLAVFGEIGLAGEVRAAARAEARTREAINLGMGRIICPDRMRATGTLPAACAPIRRIAQIIDVLPGLAASL